MTDRTFTREQLKAWDLPGAWADDSPEILHREQVDSRRWVSVHELIFRAPDDGKAYRIYYDEPLTEMQEADPWNDDREVKGTEVEQRAKTITTWEPVTDAPPPSADAPASPATVDLSEWAANIGADGLEPSPNVLNLDGDDKPIVRLHMAFDPDLPERARQQFDLGLAQVMADAL